MKTILFATALLAVANAAPTRRAPKHPHRLVQRVADDDCESATSGVATVAGTSSPAVATGSTTAASASGSTSVEQADALNAMFATLSAGDACDCEFVSSFSFFQFAFTPDHLLQFLPFIPSTFPSCLIFALLPRYIYISTFLIIHSVFHPHIFLLVLETA